MSKTPVAGTSTEGRTLGTDWTVANVARLLRANAGTGAWNSAGTVGSAAAVNQYYLRRVSARHLPTGVSLIFLRLEREQCWYASLGFVADGGYLPWNAEVAEQWLRALFGEDRPRVQVEDAEHPSVRQFKLAMGPGRG